MNFTKTVLTICLLTTPALAAEYRCILKPATCSEAATPDCEAGYNLHRTAHIKSYYLYEFERRADLAKGSCEARAVYFTTSGFHVTCVDIPNRCHRGEMLGCEGGFALLLLSEQKTFFSTNQHTSPEEACRQEAVRLKGGR